MQLNSVLIREIRKNLNLTQQAFADKIGVSQTSIYFWEKGIKIMPVCYAIKIINLTKQAYSLDDFYLRDN